MNTSNDYRVMRRWNLNMLTPLQKKTRTSSVRVRLTNTIEAFIELVLTMFELLGV